MSDVKWIKITTNMFDDEKIKLIEAIPDADSILTIWVKLLCMAGRCNANGYIWINRDIPVSSEDLSTIFNRPLNTIRLAIQCFTRFGMIEVDDIGNMYLRNWEKYQNVLGLEKIREQTKLRVNKYREKQKQLALNEGVTLRNVSVTQQNRIDKNKNKSSSIEEEKEELQEQEQNIFSIFENNICQLTPITAEQLKLYQEDYGEEWLIAAIKETAINNKHHINYVKSILERWRNDGFKSRNNGTNPEKEKDPNRFKKSKWGNVVATTAEEIANLKDIKSNST